MTPLDWRLCHYGGERWTQGELDEVVHRERERRGLPNSCVFCTRVLMDTNGAVHLLDNERMCWCLGRSLDAVVTFDRGLR